MKAQKSRFSSKLKRTIAGVLGLSGAAVVGLPGAAAVTTEPASG